MPKQFQLFFPANNLCRAASSPPIYCQKKKNKKQFVNLSVCPAYPDCVDTVQVVSKKEGSERRSSVTSNVCFFCCSHVLPAPPPPVSFLFPHLSYT